MKKYTWLICFFGVSISLFSQKSDIYLRKLQNLSRYNYVDTDTARIWITESIPDLLIFSLQKEKGEDFFCNR